MKKKGNKKWPTPRQKVIHNPIPTSLLICLSYIRQRKDLRSVDAPCRDDTSEISRDPRLQTRRESLARPSKHTNNTHI